MKKASGLAARLDRVLSELQTLVSKYGFSDRVDDLARLRQRLCETGPEGVGYDLVGGEWWGGAGSMADLLLYRPDQNQDKDYYVDNRAYRGLLIDLHDTLKAAGFTSDIAESRVNIFREWRRAGI